MSDAASGEAVENISQRELSRELAWRSGLLDFENAPLGEVVQEMQRYTRLKIDITEDGLGDLKFGGVFRAGETEAFFDALELSFGVEVVRLSDDRVLLQSAG
jgi:transmembrane sensor